MTTNAPSSTLTERHKKDLYGSGLTDKTIADAGCYSIQNTEPLLGA